MNKRYLQADLSTDAQSSEGLHIMQCIWDCKDQVKQLQEFADQDSITEKELEMFVATAKALSRRAAALESWSEDLTIDDWVPEDEI